MNIANMGGAIEHWLGFQDKIGRSFMMNEDSLKYPLADYLVNEGNVNTKSIDLEKAHPNFSNRLVDVSVWDKANHVLKNIFELKLAKKATRTQSEKQRIFNDLIRLYLAKTVTNDKCYFIITGKSVNFLKFFQNYTQKGNYFYKKWFVFIKGESLTFDVATENEADYLKIYNEFVAQYSSVYQSPDGNELKLPQQITTTCEFITGFKTSFVPYMAGIWSVS